MNIVSKWLVKWGLLVLVAGVLVLASLGMVSVSDSPVGTVRLESGGRGSVLLADLATEEENAELIGELALKDPTPLFLPTRWNSGQVDRAMTAERSSGASFGQIGAKWVFPNDENRMILPDGVVVPDSAVSALDGMEARLEGGELARKDDLGLSLPVRAGFMEVVAIGTGETVFRKPLELAEEGTPINAPIEAMLAINAGGFWVRPTVAQLVEGGAVEFDQVNLMLREARLETFLEPGFYRILLGP